MTSVSPSPQPGELEDAKRRYAAGATYLEIAHLYEVPWHTIRALVDDAFTLERFEAKFIRRGPDDCWLWTGARSRAYGKFWFERRDELAHRVAHVLYVGPIPDGLTIDHLCCTPPCVNPAHFELVTQSENLRREHKRRWAGELTHCKNGHEFTPENTYQSWRDVYTKTCRTCRREYERERRAAA